MAKKCKTPKMSLGGNLLSYGGQGAGLGMSIGGPMGAAIGGGLGMIGGIFMNRAEKQAQAEAKRLQEEQIAKQQLAMNKQADQQVLSSFPTTGVNQSYFEDGGKISPTMKLMDGKKHSQGGIPINYKGRKIEVEDDEVIDKQMDYVYSDKVYAEDEEINQLLQILNV